MGYAIVSGMATRKILSIPKKREPHRVKLFFREWRKFMGVSAPAVAEALDIERESYLKIERETWRASYADAIIIAKAVGVHVSQLQFPPPREGQPAPESADALLEGAPENVRQMAFAALRGMIGR